MAKDRRLEADFGVGALSKPHWLVAASPYTELRSVD
jgi:hypothetical protein